MFLKYEKNKDEDDYEKKLNECEEWLKLIVSKSSDHLINIFNLENEQDKGFDYIFLKAFSRGFFLIFSLIQIIIF